MISVWSRGEPEKSMDEAILADLGDVVRRHPWWRARARLVGDLLRRLGILPPALVLDAGCGWGVTLDDLDRRGYAAHGLDVSPRALERLDRERPGRTLIEADLSRDWPDLAAGGPYDAVLALDVIEHLDDDRAALARLGRLVRPGGVVVVSVPALPELFSEFDAIQGHRRRYRPETLRSAFEGTGLDVASLFWWGGWMLPLLSRRSGRSRGRPGETPDAVYRRYLALPPWPGPWALRLAFALEHRRALDGALRRGTSLFAVARPIVADQAPGPNTSTAPETDDLTVSP